MKSVDGELYWHVNKKSKRNQNEDGDNCRSLLQGEWYHLLVFVVCKIVLVLSGNCCYMCCHCRNMLHQVCTSRIDNDNVHQSLKIVSNDGNIHSSPCMAGGKVGKFSLYVNFTFQHDNCNGISKCIMGCNAFIAA
jgi:hypothetical protein